MGLREESVSSYTVLRVSYPLSWFQIFFEDSEGFEDEFVSNFQIVKVWSGDCVPC